MYKCIPHFIFRHRAFCPLDIESDLPDPHKALWEAHHARHDPALLNDPDAAQHKRQLVDEIEIARMRGDRAAASELFMKLHAMLADMRKNHHDQIEQFDLQVQASRAWTQSSELAKDRTWPFPLYSQSKLIELKERIIQTLDARR